MLKINFSKPDSIEHAAKLAAEISGSSNILIKNFVFNPERFLTRVLEAGKALEELLAELEE